MPSSGWRGAQCVTRYKNWTSCKFDPFRGNDWIKGGVELANSCSNCFVVRGPISQTSVFDGSSVYLPGKRLPHKCWRFLKPKRADCLGLNSTMRPVIWRCTLLLGQAKGPVASDCGWLTNGFGNKYVMTRRKTWHEEKVYLHTYLTSMRRRHQDHNKTGRCDLTLLKPLQLLNIFLNICIGFSIVAV